MPHDFHRGRHTGLLVPLFSVPSRASWGVGEIPDLVDLARWIRNGSRPEFAVFGDERDGD
jgi:4-alpha-glucanotransferase